VFQPPPRARPTCERGASVCGGDPPQVRLNELLHHGRFPGQRSSALGFEQPFAGRTGALAGSASSNAGDVANPGGGGSSADSFSGGRGRHDPRRPGSRGLGPAPPPHTGRSAEPTPATARCKWQAPSASAGLRGVVARGGTLRAFPGLVDAGARAYPASNADLRRASSLRWGHPGRPWRPRASREADRGHRAHAERGNVDGRRGRRNPVAATCNPYAFLARADAAGSSHRVRTRRTGGLCHPRGRLAVVPTVARRGRDCRTRRAGRGSRSASPWNVFGAKGSGRLNASPRLAFLLGDGHTRIFG